MRKEVFAGRTALKRLFRDFFNKVIEDEKDSRSFLSFGKQRDQDVVLTPKIILFRGENGLGKSAALKQCTEYAQEIATESKKILKVVTIDFEEWFLRKGCLPVTTKELMSAIVETATEKAIGISHYFGRYNELSTKVEKLSKNIENIISAEWARELFVEPVSLDSSDLHQNCDIWARKRLPRQDSDLFDKSEKKAVEALTTAFIDASVEYPLILSIDSIELLNDELVQWIRKDFLSSLLEHKNRIMTIISGNCNFVRGFRSAFSEELIFTFNFSDLTLSTYDIAGISSKLHITTSEQDVKRIEEYSAGIPLIVQDIFDYAEKKIPLDNILIPRISELSDINMLTGEILQRFISNSDQMTKERVFHLCMCNQFTPALLAKLWNISFSDVNNCINELSANHSFFKNKRVQSPVRSYIRTFLLQETALGSGSVYNDFFNNFSKISFDFFQEQLSQLNTTLPTLEKRYNDERFCSVISGMFTNMLWTSPEEAFGQLPGFYLEMIHFNAKCAMDLLWQLDEFRPILSTTFQDILDILKKGIYTGSSSVFRNRVPVNDSEKEVLAYINGCIALFNDERKALLFHSLGRLEFRNNQYQNALGFFKKALALVENNENEKDLFFEDFSMLGYGFFANTEAQSAVDAFSYAVKVKPESFLPWLDMGVSYITMGKFEDAIGALNKAVAINPDHQEAWYNLGTCNNRQNNHAEAVQSFTKAVEKGPPSAQLWFEMGNSFQNLDQHEEAVKSYGKVVGIDPGNAEAWYLMGKSNSALSISQEAILSYQKAIELRVDYFEAYYALGMEYITIKRFSEAAEILEKSVSLQPENAELWFYIAEAWYKADKFENAITIGKKAVELNNNHGGAYFIIGRSHTAMSDFESALDAFMRASEIDPSNAEIWNEIGNNYYAQSNYSEAIGAFHKALQADPLHEGPWHSIGLAHQIQEQYDLAVEAFTKAIEVQPENTESWFQKGRVHMVLEQYEQAIESFSRTVELTPDSHDAWYRKGLSLARTKAYKEAIESFNKAVELWHSDADIWYNLGHSYAALGFHEEAVQAFTEATKLAPSRFELHHNLGLSLQALTHFQEAIEAYTKALDIQPDKTETISSIAKCYYHLSQYELARNYFFKVIDETMANTDALYYLALTCHAVGSYEEAITYYKLITNAKPEFTEAWFNSAVAYHALGNYTSAIDIYIQIVNDKSDHGAAWYNLGIAYHALNELDNAIRSYREASKLDSENADIWYQMGIAYHTLEQYGEAIQAYRKVIQINPSHVEAFFNLGLAYYIWNHYEDAVESFKKAIDLQPDHFGALSNLVLANFESGNLQNTIESAEKSIAAKPDESWIYAYLITSYAMNGHSKVAGEKLDTLLSFDSNGPDITRTHYLLKKALAKKPVEDAVVILNRLDEILQSQQSAVQLAK